MHALWPQTTDVIALLFGNLTSNGFPEGEGEARNDPPPADAATATAVGLRLPINKKPGKTYKTSNIISHVYEPVSATELASDDAYAGGGMRYGEATLVAAVGVSRVVVPTGE